MNASLLVMATVLVVCSSQAQTTTVEIVGGEKIENTFPLCASTQLFYSADLYLSTEINTEGTISAIAFFQSSGQSETKGQCKIYLGAIASKTLPSTDWATLTGLATLVYDGTYCRSQLGWSGFFLDKAFQYDGRDNLLVLCESNGEYSASEGSENYYHFTTCKRSATAAATKQAPAELSVEEMTSWILLTLGSLPVQLTSFNAEATGAGIAFFWRTASEMNNYGFYVQAKHRREEDYADIPDVFVPGHGTTILENSYSITIGGSHEPGTSFRLRQVDLGGAMHFSEAVTAIASDVESVVTREFILSHNYPNPFNPTTTIRFTIGGVVALSGASSSGDFPEQSRGVEGPAATNVHLAVYDMLGREVAALVDEKKQPGSYEVQFDGSGLSSGVYFYRIHAGDFVQTRRLFLLK